MGDNVQVEGNEANSKPVRLPDCDPHAANFPIEWKGAYFRRNKSSNGYVDGYVCPMCNTFFSGRDGYKTLQRTHIKPLSLGGLTVWDNMTLLCDNCKRKKERHERLK